MNALQVKAAVRYFDMVKSDYNSTDNPGHLMVEMVNAINKLLSINAKGPVSYDEIILGETFGSRVEYALEWRNNYLWKRLHNYGMSRIRQDIDRIYANMVNEEDDLGVSFGGFSNYYMDNHSPNADNNIYA